MDMTIRVYTEDGLWELEDAYVPRVVAAEIGAAPPAALRAQAIAVRTFVLRAMRDDPKLGTSEKPIRSSESFQVYNGHASWKTREQALYASWLTAGIVMRWSGQLIIANYVAGARWNGKDQLGDDYSHTEKWVTYNEGKTGKDVKPSPISNTKRPDNRGCMSQNGASWLAAHDYKHPEILRYFYGADIDIGPLVQLAAPSPGPRPPEWTAPTQPQTSGSSTGPLVMLAALAALALEP